MCIKFRNNGDGDPHRPGQRLEHGVKNFTKYMSPEQRDIVVDQIRQNPGVSANISSINASPELVGTPTRGQYFSNAKRAKDMVQRIYPQEQYIPNKLLDEILTGQTSHPGGFIQMRPDLDTRDFGRVLRHEYNHAAQDMTGKLDDLHGWTNEVAYEARPQEIGSRLAEYRHRWLLANAEANGMSIPEWLEARKTGVAKKYFETPNMPNVLTDDLNKVEQFLPPDPDIRAGWNNSLMYMNHEMKNRGSRKQITASMPTMSTGSTPTLPKRYFKVEDVVLGLPPDRKLW